MLDEFDLIHDKSGSFFRHAAECPVPVLATLHLPRSFYREEWFRTAPPQNLYFNCVSQSQVASFMRPAELLGVVRTESRSSDFRSRRSKSDYLLWLGRICEEKGAAPGDCGGAAGRHAAGDRRPGLSLSLSPGLF